MIKRFKVFISFCLILMLVGCGNVTPDNVEIGKIDVESKEHNQVEKESITEEQVSGPVDLGYIQPGIVLNLNGIQYLVENIFWYEDKYNEPKDGCGLVVLEFTVHNTTTFDTSVSGEPWDVYEDGFTIDDEILFDYDGYDYLSGSIAPNKKVKGYLAYQVNKDFKELEFLYRENMFDDDYDAFFKLSPEGIKNDKSVDNVDTTVYTGEYDEEQLIGIGSYLDVDGVRFIFDDIYEYQSDRKYALDAAKEGNIILLFEMTIENNSDEDYIQFGNPFDAFVDGYSVDDILLYDFDKFDHFSDTIAPGKKSRGYIAYELSEDFINLEFQYKSNMFNDVADVTFAYQNNRK